MPIVRKYAHHRQIAPYAHLKVVRVVRRSYFDCAGAEFLFNIFVGNYGYLAPYHGYHNGLTDYTCIPFIVRMHGYCGIAQYGLGPCRGYGYGIALIRRIVAHMPKMALLLLIFHLGIAERGLAVRAPVYYPVSPVYKALFVKLHKHLCNSL